MHATVYYNDGLVSALEARVRAASGAMLYGRGVFTTLAVYEGRPFLWPRHWARLSEHARRAGVETGELEEERVRAALAELIEANGVREGRARVTLLSNREESVWKLVGAKGADREGARQTNLLIMTGEAHTVSDDEGLALTVSPYRLNSHSPLAGVKSLNYLDHVLAQEEARGRGFQETVRLNERGEVVSAAMANIFWVESGRVYTPALQTGALAGTTRARVIELAHELSIPLVEGVYDLSALGDAHEIFLTSAGQGLRIVTTFDFRQYTVAVGSQALRLREAFRALRFEAE